MEHKRLKVPQLAYSTNRNIGYHVSYRHPVSGMPTKKKFGMIAQSAAALEYAQWLAVYLEQRTRKGVPSDGGGECLVVVPSPNLVAQGNSLAAVASGLLAYEQARVRDRSGARAQGTIDPTVYADREKHLKDFLFHLNTRHGQGAVGSMTLESLTMADVETYNKALSDQDYSASQVQKRMQIVKRLIDRAGRPEHGLQVLRWNWDSRDTAHGRPPAERMMPTLEQFKSILAACQLKEQTMIWIAVGLGFGQRDIGALRVSHIDKQSYDMRRGKTGIERYGDTPPKVWAMVTQYLKANPVSGDGVMFRTKRGDPIADGTNDAVQQWWTKLRASLELEEKIGGFYMLRHLGATEYGNRPGCSIGSMKRWLGHSASSSIADVYMKPVPPENKALIGWVRKELSSCSSRS